MATHLQIAEAINEAFRRQYEPKIAHKGQGKSNLKATKTHSLSLFFKVLVQLTLFSSQL